MMCCLGAAKKEAANPGPPPGLKLPQRFDIFTPQKKPDPQPVGEIAQWCDKHGMPEAVDALTYNGLRALAEIAVLSDTQLEALRRFGDRDVRAAEARGASAPPDGAPADRGGARLWVG